MEETHIQICEENKSGACPIIYDGKFSDKDFVNKDVIAGELLHSMLGKLHEFDITIEDLCKAVDKGKKVIIMLWKSKINEN